MKLITEIENINNLEKYNVEGIIFSYHRFGTISKKTFSVEEIKTIVNYCCENQKLAILKIDKIIEETEVDDVYDFLNLVSSLNINYYMFTDMSILNYFMDKQMNDKLIFCAKTLNCSFNDCSFYDRLGIKVMLSNELTIEDITEISKLPNIVIDGYGYSNIFYSKRSLLSLYRENKQLEKDLRNQLMYIEEENRDAKYPIYENENGTFIFTAYKYVFYKELEVLKNISLFKIESLFIEEEQLFKVIDIFRKAIDEGISDNDYQKLIEIDENIGHSFLYTKPLILREAKDEKN
jgi:putative protease